MENKKSFYYICFLILFGIGLWGYYTNFVQKESGNEPITAVKPVDVELEESGGEDFLEKNKGENQITVKAPVISLKIPDLDRPVVVPASVPLQQKEEAVNKIDSIITLLRSDPTLFNEWLDLGLLRKSIGDYDGAREAWEYASAIRPKNSLSFGNLAVLYGYYLQNPVLAEGNYLRAIENDPALPYLYMQAADFYKEVLKDIEKAKAILKKGIEVVPEDGSLKGALDSL